MKHEGIDFFKRCSCGAVTAHKEDGTSFSMKASTFKKLFPNTRVSRKNVYINCNHCCNHWGIDLCGCGSGEPVGKCKGDFAECKNKEPSQYADHEIKRPMWR